jgi:UDP-N-acetylmuramyl tripeptide synthase
MTTGKHIAKNLVIAWLKQHEVKARNTKVGVNFVYEGWNFLLWNDADDPLFFRLALPGIFDVNDDNYAVALLACNTLNWNYKVVKASLYEYEEAGKRHASVWVCFEQMLEGATTDPEIVTRAVTSLMEAAERFQTLVER